MSNYQDLESYTDIKDHVEAWFRLRALNTQIRWKTIGNHKYMDLLKVIFLNADVSYATNLDLVIVVNPDIYDKLSEDATVLDTMINEALDIVGYQDGKVKKLKQDYTTNSYFQEKVGIEKLVLAKTIKKEIIESHKQTLKENK